MKTITESEFIEMMEKDECLNERVLISDRNLVAIPWAEYSEILKVVNPEKLTELEKAFAENKDCNVFIEN